MNRVTLFGNVGADPEIRSMSSGDRVANFSLATSERWKDKTTGERREKSEWHRVVVWGDGLVGVVEKFVGKGSKLLIEGKIQTRKWTDQAGVEKYSTEIVIQGLGGSLTLAGGGPGAAGDDKPASGGVASGGLSRTMDDDIPF